MTINALITKLDERNDLTMDQLKKYFTELSTQYDKTSLDVERMRLKFFPFVVEYYRVNKSVLKKHHTQKTYCAEILGLSAKGSQVTLYNKVSLILDQFPDEKTSGLSLQEIAKKYEIKKGDNGKACENEKGDTIYDVRLPSVTETKEITNQMLLDGKRAELVELLAKTKQVKADILALQQVISDEAKSLADTTRQIERQMAEREAKQAAKAA